MASRVLPRLALGQVVECRRSWAPARFRAGRCVPFHNSAPLQSATATSAPATGWAFSSDVTQISELSWPCLKWTARSVTSAAVGTYIRLIAAQQHRAQLRAAELDDIQAGLLERNPHHLESLGAVGFGNRESLRASCRGRRRRPIGRAARCCDLAQPGQNACRRRAAGRASTSPRRARAGRRGWSRMFATLPCRSSFAPWICGSRLRTVTGSTGSALSIIPKRAENLASGGNSIGLDRERKRDALASARPVSSTMSRGISTVYCADSANGPSKADRRYFRLIARLWASPLPVGGDRVTRWACFQATARKRTRSSASAGCRGPWAPRARTEISLRMPCASCS